MEKLLYAGGKKDLTLELLNTLLMSREDECFATVDLCEIDLYTGKGEFIKAGAAPAFVIRKGVIFKIQSATVPVGIINNMNAEQTSVSFEDGDVIVMLSDGVIQSCDEGAWLLELLGHDGTSRSAGELAEHIVREARTVNRRRDDISAAVMFVRELR
jgi:stage II sporulation protein E